ncbi:MAG: hypothetical protein LBH00_11850 [Planctomycetaceae bacterium]|jgi:hypothetical protein|nr:hypothetical protein [Planctomycetaceae bacterium]
MTPKRRPFEALILANGLVSAEDLKHIRSYAAAVGIELYEAVLQKKSAVAEAVMTAYAESLGLPFIRLDEVMFDETLIGQIDPITARQHSFIPVKQEQGCVILAAAKPIVPNVEDEIRMLFGMPVRCVICIPAELNTAIAKYYPRHATRVIKPDAKAADFSPAIQKQSAKTEDEELTAEQKKNRILLAFVAFIFTFLFFHFIPDFLPFPKSIAASWYFRPLFFFIGMTAAGSAAAAVWKKLSR